jgi:hypothetical protein
VLSVEPNREKDPTYVLGEVLGIESYTCMKHAPGYSGPPIPLGERTYTAVKATVIASGCWELPTRHPGHDKSISRNTRPVPDGLRPGQEATFTLDGDVKLEPGTVVKLDLPWMAFGAPTTHEVIEDYDPERDYLTPEFYVPLEERKAQTAARTATTPAIVGTRKPRGLLARLKALFGG